MRAGWRNEQMSMEGMKETQEANVVPTIFYGCETWVLNVRNVSRLKAAE